MTLLVILAAMFLMYADSISSVPSSNPGFLFRRKGLCHTYVKILLPSTLLLYGSTILYTASLASHIISINRLVAQAQSGLFSTAFTTANMDAFERDVLKQSWMMTTAVSVNVSRVSELSTYLLDAIDFARPLLGPDRRQYRVVARVRRLEASDRVLPRTSAHRTDHRYVTPSHW